MNSAAALISDERKTMRPEPDRRRANPHGEEIEAEEERCDDAIESPSRCWGAR